MAGKDAGSAVKLRDLFVVLMICIWSTAGQENLERVTHLSTGKLEDTVFLDMLTIVDNKFNTLTSRITALETAVSSLQFYSIRHFRQISGSLQSTDNDLETVGKQVTQLEDDIRQQTSVVSLLAGEVSELKKSSTDLFSEIESSAFYINDNFDKQGKLIKTLLEDTMAKSARESTAQLSKQMEDMIQQLEKQKTEPVGCLVDFSGISEHIDLRFAEFKMQTHAHFVKLINAAKFDLRRGKRFTEDKSENDDSTKKGESESDDSKKKGDKSCDCKTELMTNRNVSTEDNVRSGIHDPGNRTDIVNTAENVTPQTSSNIPKYQDENDEKVMNALYNMTTSVLQAVSYFRNTGRLLEQIISNTDSLASQQTDLTRKLNLLHAGGHVPIQVETSDLSNVIPDAEVQHPYKKSLSGTNNAEKGCVLSMDMFGNVATIIKNGSQLMEILTDLAQLSSVSLTKTTAALQDEVTRVEGIRTQMATTMLARINGDEADPVTRLTNTTQKTIKLVEAIATNTAWLPQIFTNIQQLESLTNRSLYTLMQNYAMLRQAQQTDTAQDSATNVNQEENNAITSRRISRTQGLGDRPHHGSVNVSSKDEATTNKESLQTINSTSLQVKRIITKLLSEPDPLITLAGGGRPDQGRVEIYHNGLWGALCHAELSHFEADLICRHLGFRGGISAGAGHFGPGAGITWTFNASCLANSQCAVVAYSEDTAHCSHDLDTGVICDHMLRIISSDGSSRGKVGRLEIHHQGVWLPICGEGWSGYSARVACQQMGFSDGREMEADKVEVNSKWLNNVACIGRETRLDACHTDGWRDSCPGQVPAGVRCV